MCSRFDFLRPYKLVLVVGPQRSGTTITARMIAHDLGRTFLDERQVKGPAELRMEELPGRRAPCVVQCPAWTYCCHRWGGPEVGVVLVRRPVPDILASQQRIRWTHRCQPGELARYDLSSGVISQVKYRVWDRQQRRMLGPHGHEIEYHTLKDHPLWVPPQRRRNFHAKQTEIGDYRL